MGRLESLHGQRVYFDTNVFVYAIELNAGEIAVESLRAAVRAAQSIVSLSDNGEITAATSELALMEVLVKPIQLGMTGLADFYRSALQPGGQIDLVPIDRVILETAAQLRATTQLKSPDAIHLSSAMVSHCETFICNDARLAKIVEETTALKSIFLESFDN